jgi:cation diffusion facilitator CzcD-associated flavoprotein CzcO
VVDRFDLRPHLSLSTSVLSAVWDESTATWEVKFKNVQSNYEYTKRFKTIVSACGIFSRPKYPDLPGIDLFQGGSWHSGKWDHSVDISNKKVAVIGNGCSGCQIIPAIAPKVKNIHHFTRSKQWLFERVSSITRGSRGFADLK